MIENRLRCFSHSSHKHKMVWRFIIGVGILFQGSLFPSLPSSAKDSLPERLDCGDAFNQLYAQESYTCFQCDLNVARLITIAKDKGVDLSHARVLWISRHGTGSLRPAMHRALTPELKKKLKSTGGKLGWPNHFVLEDENHFIYDFDLADHPVRLSREDYFKNNFLTSATSSVGREQRDILIQEIPVPDLLPEGKPEDIRFYFSKMRKKLDGVPEYPYQTLDHFLGQKSLSAPTSSPLKGSDLVIERIKYLEQPVSSQVLPGGSYTLTDGSTGETHKVTVLEIFNDGWAKVRKYNASDPTMAYVDLKKMDPAKTWRGFVWDRFSEFKPDDVIYYHDRQGKRFTGRVIGYSSHFQVHILPEGSDTPVFLGEYDLNPYNHFGLEKPGVLPRRKETRPDFSSYREGGKVAADHFRSQLVERELTFLGKPFSGQLRENTAYTLYNKTTHQFEYLDIVEIFEDGTAKVRTFENSGQMRFRTVDLTPYDPLKTRVGRIPEGWENLWADDSLTITGLDGSRTSGKLLGYTYYGQIRFLPDGGYEQVILSQGEIKNFELVKNGARPQKTIGVNDFSKFLKNRKLPEVAPSIQRDELGNYLRQRLPHYRMGKALSEKGIFSKYSVFELPNQPKILVSKDPKMDPALDQWLQEVKKRVSSSIKDLSGKLKLISDLVTRAFERSKTVTEFKGKNFVTLGELVGKKASIEGQEIAALQIALQEVGMKSQIQVGTSQISVREGLRRVEKTITPHLWVEVDAGDAGRFYVDPSRGIVQNLSKETKRFLFHDIVISAEPTPFEFRFERGVRRMNIRDLEKWIRPDEDYGM